MLVIARVQEKAAFKLLQYILLEMKDINPFGLPHISLHAQPPGWSTMHSMGAKEEEIRLT